MTTLNTKFHGVIDYTLSIVLMISPWLFDYSRGSIETFIPLSIGFISFTYTLFTDCEFGIFKKIRLSNHLLIDLIIGSFLVAAPKLFHYNGYVYMLPYLWIGLIKIFISLAAGNVLHSKHLEQSSRPSSTGIPFKTFLHPIQQFSIALNKQTHRERKSIIQ